MNSIVIAALFTILPFFENRQVLDVARRYQLNEEQTALMCAIRRAENGRPALAFGVTDPRCRTFRDQARWTANTIRRRYTGDIDAFARRWCPTDSVNWARMVRYFMRRQGISK